MYLLLSLLGYIVSAEGIKCDPDKTEAISKLNHPTNVRGVRSFLGMASYYRQCINNFAKLAAPLVQLTRKHVRFHWGEEQQHAFDTLKQSLTSSTVMAHPKLNEPYKLYTDACDYAVGAILVQTDEHGIERPIQYISKKLAGSQLHWPVIEKEAYAVIHALTKLRTYLLGSVFTIYTDHKPLKSLFLKEVKNTKLQRWACLIAEYGAAIKYRKGANNIRADMLSRIQHIESVNIACADTDTDWFAAEDAEGDPNHIPFEFDQLELEELRREQREMPEYQLASEEESGYEIKDGLLYSLRTPTQKLPYPRLVLPSSARFRVIRRAHCEVGHQSTEKTMDRILEAYKWPGMRSDVKRTLAQCHRCLINSEKREYPQPTSMPIAQYPNQIIGLDLTGPLPISRYGNRYILVIIDHCSGFIEAKPIPTKESIHILRYLDQEYIPRYGTPEIAITDRGAEFQALPLRQYMEELGIEHRSTTPYKPSTNGRTERANKTLKSIIRKLVNNNPNSWEEVLGHALWAVRISTSTVTGFTPFFLQFGRRPRVPLSKMLGRTDGSDPRAIGARIELLSDAFKQAAR